jgi:hypothetical protein
VTKPLSPLTQFSADRRRFGEKLATIGVSSQADASFRKARAAQVIKQSRLPDSDTWVPTAKDSTTATLLELVIMDHIVIDTLIVFDSE